MTQHDGTNDTLIVWLPYQDTEVMQVRHQLVAVRMDTVELRQQRERSIQLLSDLVTIGVAVLHA